LWNVSSLYKNKNKNKTKKSTLMLKKVLGRRLRDAAGDVVSGVTNEGRSMREFEEQLIQSTV
jgi:hypothetical protein